MFEGYNAGPWPPQEEPGYRADLVIDPGDIQFEGEHALSIQIAADINHLDQYRQYLHQKNDPCRTPLCLSSGEVYVPKDVQINTREAQELRQLVENAHYGLFRDKEPDHWDHEGSAKIANNILIDKINDLDSHLRSVWLENYYKPRTRVATRDDFQGWLDCYIAEYGEAVLTKTFRVNKKFSDMYTPFRGVASRARVMGGLRISTQDTLLIPGYGANMIGVIEGEDTTVERALPNVRDHHTMYTLRTPPETYPAIYIPKDIRCPRPGPATP